MGTNSVAMLSKRLDTANEVIVLTPMRNETGELIGDFTIACARKNRFMVWGSQQA
jgi:glycine cleavage system aminomethyltransferase T